MPIKYECPKCGRRFAEWGAEKVGFKCPRDQWATADHPDDVDLVRVGSVDDGSPRRPKLKRTQRKVAAKKAPLPIEMNEDEAMVPDLEGLEADADLDSADDELIEVANPEGGEEIPVEDVKLDDDAIS